MYIFGTQSREVFGTPIPKLRLKILIGDNPEEVNKYIKRILLITWKAKT